MTGQPVLCTNCNDIINMEIRNTWVDVLEKYMQCFRCPRCLKDIPVFFLRKEDNPTHRDSRE